MFNSFGKFTSLLALILAVGASACGAGGGGGASEETTVTKAAAVGDCVPDHMMPNKKAVWTYLDCGPSEYIWITPDTKDTVTGAEIGKREVSHGRISFKMTGLNNMKMDVNETFAFFFEAIGYNKTSRSIRWTSKKLSTDGLILSRLGAVRYSSECTVACDERFDTQELQFWDESEVYAWDCTWSHSTTLIHCSVTKPADPSYRVNTWNLAFGPYIEFKYLGVGKNAYSGFYKNYDAIVSDFRLTFFE